MARTGIFVCWCGRNIAQTVDVEKLAEKVKSLPGVVHSSEYKYMCSEPGQKTIQEAIEKNKLDRVLVAACSPRLHESTFRNTCIASGVNPYQCEIANIREQCSWVHSDMEKATSKAEETIAGLTEKIELNEALIPIKVPVTKRAVVVGGGVSGIHSALNIADSGFDVLLVERKSILGGHMADLAETYLTHDSTPILLSALIARVRRHPHIKILTSSNIDELDGFIGNYKVKIKKQATFIDPEKCDGCGICKKECPVLDAIQIPILMDIPQAGIIDPDKCLHFTESCQSCVKVCPKDAINFKQKDTCIEEDIGALVLATGYDLFTGKGLSEYGLGKIPDIIDGYQFEQMLSHWTNGKIELKKPSNGKIPKDIVFVMCAGSRDQEKGVPYCSRICCMYVAKQARLFKQAVPDGEAFIFYTQNRPIGKGCEEYVQGIVDDKRLLYLRGEISKIFKRNDKVIVWGEDDLSGQKIEVTADLVVLATPMKPAEGMDELAKKVKVALDENGFLAEVHPKLRPVESATAGIYLAGCAQFPRDIPESITHALGAASKVNALFSADELSRDPIIVYVDEDLCTGCGACIEACPYDARKIDPWSNTAAVIEAVCQGCGACCVACPGGATQQKNFTKQQLFKMIDTAL